MLKKLKWEDTMSTYQVKCQSCGTSNRIPAEKEGIPGHCGNCQATLPALYYRPQPLTDHNFDTFIASFPGVVIVEFWASW
jgi:hypothetical protein